MKYVSAFGWFHGLSLFIRLKLLSSGSVQLPGIAGRIYLRPGSIDVYSIDEVFIQKVYAIDWPAAWPEPKLIIDGGANIGFTSVFMANRFPQAHIIAVEPESENFELLQMNIQDYSRIQAIKGGIWSRSALLEVRDLGFGKRGFTVEEVRQQSASSISAYSIETLREMGNSPVIDILKLDVEGSEKEIFRLGFEAWLPHCRCVIVELHDRMLEGCSKAVFSAMNSYDFSCELKGGNLVFYSKKGTEL